MRTTGFLYAILAAVSWGLVYTIDQKILTKASPLALLFIDSILTAAILLPLVFLDSQPLKLLTSSGKFTIGLIVLSVALATLANFFIFSGIKILGASTASIFEIAYPFFVVIFSAIFLRAGINIYFLIGAAFIFLGSFVIIKFA